MPLRSVVALLLSVLMALPAAAVGICGDRGSSGGDEAAVACCGPLCACGAECPCRASTPVLPESPEPMAPAAGGERLLAWEGDAAARSPAMRRPPSRTLVDREPMAAAGGREVLLRKRVLRT
jgi:hypothetical protein